MPTTRQVKAERAADQGRAEQLQARVDDLAARMAVLEAGVRSALTPADEGVREALTPTPRKPRKAAAARPAPVE